jgi:hypothetical protein
MKVVLGSALSLILAVSTPSVFAKDHGGGHGRGHGRGHAMRFNDDDHGDRDFRRARVRAVGIRDPRVVSLSRTRVVTVRSVRPVTLVRDQRFYAGRTSMRFRGLDTNHNGVITRREWRGNDTSFRVHDRNGDGILSGYEVRTGVRRHR